MLAGGNSHRQPSGQLGGPVIVAQWIGAGETMTTPTEAEVVEALTLERARAEKAEAEMSNAIGVLADEIARRKRAEAALAEAMEKLRRVADYSDGPEDIGDWLVA